MPDVFKTFIKHMDGVDRARTAEIAATVMAQHCDERIAKAAKAIAREEKYLRRLVHSKTAGGVMTGDIEGAFARLRTALGAPNGKP